MPLFALKKLVKKVLAEQEQEHLSLEGLLRRQVDDRGLRLHCLGDGGQGAQEEQGEHEAQEEHDTQEEQEVMTAKVHVVVRGYTIDCHV